MMIWWLYQHDIVAGLDPFESLCTHGSQFIGRVMSFPQQKRMVIAQSNGGEHSNSW